MSVRACAVGFWLCGAVRCQGAAAAVATHMLAAACNAFTLSCFVLAGNSVDRRRTAWRFTGSSMMNHS